MNSKELYPYSKALDNLPDEVFWSVYEELEQDFLNVEDLKLNEGLEEIEFLIRDIDASVAKITAMDEDA